MDTYVPYWWLAVEPPCLCCSWPGWSRGTGGRTSWSGSLRRPARRGSSGPSRRLKGRFPAYRCEDSLLIQVETRILMQESVLISQVVLVLSKFCKIVSHARFFRRCPIAFLAFTLKLPNQTLLSVAAIRSVFWYTIHFQQSKHTPKI